MTEERLEKRQIWWWRTISDQVRIKMEATKEGPGSEGFEVMVVAVVCWSMVAGRDGRSWSSVVGFDTSA